MAAIGMFGRDRGAPWKGLLAGAVGGLLASWAMNQSHALWRKIGVALGVTSDAGEQDRQGGSKEEVHLPSSDDATANAATVISRRLFHHEPTRRERHLGGALVHYTFGAATGALYGSLGEVFPSVRVGKGTPYGAAVWLLSDEIMVPLLGLSKPPTAFPPAAHIAALASHLVYGLTLELARGSLRRSPGRAR